MQKECKKGAKTFPQEPALLEQLQTTMGAFEGVAEARLREALGSLKTLENPSRAAAGPRAAAGSLIHTMTCMPDMT